MPNDRSRLERKLRDVAGETPTYLEVTPTGFVTYFLGELEALRVAYYFRKRDVVCKHRPALGIWAVTVKG